MMAEKKQFARSGDRFFSVEMLSLCVSLKKMKFDFNGLVFFISISAVCLFALRRLRDKVRDLFRSLHNGN